MILRLERAWRTVQRWLSRRYWLVRLLGLANDDTTRLESNTGPMACAQRGLVMVQIDGLGLKELTTAMDRGELPFLRRLLDHEHYRQHALYSGLPSSTPAVQAELFYGVRTAVPAFAFRHRATGRYDRMYDPGSAARVEQRLQQAAEGLLAGGSAWCDIYTGGASESHFCAATLGWGRTRGVLRWHTRMAIILLYLPIWMRTVGLLLIEFLLALFDSLRGVFKGHHLLPEFKFILARVAVTILLRDLITVGAQTDIVRGLPIIHLNYLGYDEQAHRRGPESAFAHWTLRGIDRAIQSLWQAAHQAPHRHYDLWVYADHGQEPTRPFERHAGLPIDQAVQRAFTALGHVQPRSVDFEAPREHHTRPSLLGAGWLQTLFPHRHLTRLDPLMEPPAVVAMGPVGHVYLAHAFGATERVQLAEHLVLEQGVPSALYRDAQGRWRAQIMQGVLNLPEDAPTLLGATHPWLNPVMQDLIALCEHEDAGDLVILGWSSTGPPLSFPDENGSHAGPGLLETSAFALLPGDTELTANTEGYLRPNDLRTAALHLLGRDRLSTPRPVTMPTRVPDTLRVMTYNVHSCIGMDSKIAPERIARIIARYEPDIVALQELDVRRPRSHGTDQAELIARLLEMEYHFHPSIHIENEQYGDAILTQLPLTLRQAGALPRHPTRRNDELRGALWVTVCFKGIEIQVFNTHLGLYSAERREQVAALLGTQWLGHPDCKGPVVLCGDLNALPSSDVLRALSTRLSDVQTHNPHFRPLKTFTGRLPTVRIDHILTAGISAVDRVSVPNNEFTRHASDHLPLFADLIIAPDKIR